VLIEPTSVVGGLNTNGLNTAETEHMLEWSVGGFAMAFYKRLGELYHLPTPEFHFESSVALEAFNGLLKEAGVSVLTGRALAGVEKNGPDIAKMRLSGASAESESLSARVFVDCSYEGDLMAAAGVPWVCGREAVEEFGEEAAGARFDGFLHNAPTRDRSGALLQGISTTADRVQEGSGDGLVMCYNLRPTLTRDPAFFVPIPEPSTYDPAQFDLMAGWLAGVGVGGWVPAVEDLVDLYERRNGKLEANNCQAAVLSLGCLGMQSAWPTAGPRERARIYQKHLDYTLGYFYFLANDERVPERLRADRRSLGLHSGEFGDNAHLPRQIYVREGRRMRGRLVMTQRDVTLDTTKGDSIGLSSHFIDCHHVQRVEMGEGIFANEGRIWRRGRVYQIPYTAITPVERDCGNLLVPVAAGFTHVAYSTLRLESVWMVTGFAAGIAAAQAVENACHVQQVSVKHLQQRLREHGQVVDLLDEKPTSYDKDDGGWGEV
jgi:hypothetical protein